MSPVGSSRCHRHFAKGVGVLSLLLALGGSLDAPAEPSPLGSQLVASGFSRPTFVTSPPHDASRLFVLEQWTGLIRTFDSETGVIDSIPFLTIDGVGTAGEQGIVGLAFHPRYADNGRFFVNWTAVNDTMIEEYRITQSGLPGAGRLILRIGQPQPGHNAGWMGFGPDGYLYVTVGDGGGPNDQAFGHTPGVGNAQNPARLLGKVLRIDVNDRDPAYGAYAVPDDNPFLGTTGADEVWAWGLRNPWRASFDRQTGDLWIGDVGQDTREEVNFQAAGSAGGANYGWRLREGMIATPTGRPVVGGDRPEGNVDPVFNYSHEDGVAVVGGYVYRGSVGELRGHYIFGDYSGRIFSMVFDGSDPEDFNGANYTDLRDRTGDLSPLDGDHTIDAIMSFGEDANGELYIADEDGEIYRVVPEPARAAAAVAAALSLLAIKRTPARTRERS